MATKIQLELATILDLVRGAVICRSREADCNDAIEAAIMAVTATALAGEYPSHPVLASMSPISRVTTVLEWALTGVRKTARVRAILNHIELRATDRIVVHCARKEG